MKWTLWCAVWAGLAGQVAAQTVIPELDPKEPAGSRPYEMIEAARREDHAPTLKFDHLAGWKVEVAGDTSATLQATRSQEVWHRPVARLKYQGNGKSGAEPKVYLIPPQPVAVPARASAVDLWIHGNRWDWENPPDTPPVKVSLHLRDAGCHTNRLLVDRVRWQEWWLAHQQMPTNLAAPVCLERIEIAGGWQKDPREIYFDSIRFYEEQTGPLAFEPRPRRNLKLWPGQSPGANTGPGTLPFPTRETTILPMHFEKNHRTWMERRGPDLYAFHYEGSDGRLAYFFDASQGLSSLRAEFNGSPIATLMKEGKIRFDESKSQALKAVKNQAGTVTATYADGTELSLQIWQKSLVLDVINRTGEATGLDFGHLPDATRPRTFWMPFLNYAGSQPLILLSQAGAQRVFSSIWVDWYRSNGSELFGPETGPTNQARINGGVRYLKRTDGVRNPLFERIFITVSPRVEEVLPTVANPAGLHARQAADRLWQETWGPDNYEKQMQRSRTLRAYGIEKLIQCNHEISWRDGGESFTLRRHAAPKKGGDEALRQYVAHQRGLGWLAGLYSNYTDFAPVNEFWTPDAVQRLPDGKWRSAWPRCWALKPLSAVQFDAVLAPWIKQVFNPSSAYTDVHTAVAPWGYLDCDARTPGAATFAQTFYAYGELLRNDSRVYDGPIFSEGSYHWLYAGLADGNYALAYNNRPLAKEPLLPVFDLYQIHTRECDIGMGWTANFCDAIPDWRKPENLDRAIDRFLLHTLAYGHIGWLVEEEHGMARTCRSYYLLQAVQARYGLETPQRIAYWDGQGLVNVSEALDRNLPATRRQLHVEYANGLKLWLNDHPTENWVVEADGRKRILPPAGWAACHAKSGLDSYSALEGSRVDFLACPEYLYQDGRGQLFSTPAAASRGGLAIRPLNARQLEVVHISGEEAFTVRRPFGRRGSATVCTAFEASGRPLPAPALTGSATETTIQPRPGAVRYVIEFSGR